MCGIVGIYSHEPVASELYDSLIHLQHRGQDAAGIMTCDERFHIKAGHGLVREIFSAHDISDLKGNIGIAHTRYPTAGGYNKEDIQPLWIGTPRGIALAHNGNLVNYRELAKHITRVQYRHLNSSLDSEVLLLTLADYLAAGSAYTDDDDQVFFDSLTSAIKKIYQTITGSYSVVSIVIGKGLVAFRDPHGIRPLVWGDRVNANGTTDYIFASETTAFYALGFTPRGDLQPGEVAFVNQEGKLFRQVVLQKEFLSRIWQLLILA